MLLALCCSAEPAWQMTTIDANQRIWRKPSDANQDPRAKARTIHEIGNGLAYWDGAQYQPSRELFEVIGNEAVALHAPHKLIVSGDANVPGCLDLELPNGAGRLRSTV